MAQVDTASSLPTICSAVETNSWARCPWVATTMPTIIDHLCLLLSGTSFTIPSQHTAQHLDLFRRSRSGFLHKRSKLTLIWKLWLRLFLFEIPVPDLDASVLGSKASVEFVDYHHRAVPAAGTAQS